MPSQSNGPGKYYDAFMRDQLEATRVRPAGRSRPINSCEVCRGPHHTRDHAKSISSSAYNQAAR